MAELLRRAGYQERNLPDEAHLLIVNTCGFIQPAREESLQVLREMAETKREGQYLVAAGCLSEREKQRLSAEVNGLDAILGTRRWAEIVTVAERIQHPQSSPYIHFPTNIPTNDDGVVRHILRAAVQGGSAYLKIADGCDRTCAFCAIPEIKGPMVSRPLEQVVADALVLQEMGVKELILIAQDTTAYGSDLGMQAGLVDLLRAILSEAPDIPWVRMMYAFPGMISDDLMHLMAQAPALLPYLDIPLQHAHPDVLKRMRRPANMDSVRATLARMRTLIPDLALRTTFIAGFPGETEAEFEALMEFVEGMRFDHVGIFPYYHESGTPAHALGDDIPQEVKEERIQRLAALQEDISLSKNQAWIGRELDVLIEGQSEGFSAGRSFRDAPEIDGLVLFNETLPEGELVRARVSGALTHDLIAEKKQGG